MYDVVYYDGWGTHPAYYLIGMAEGKTPEQALQTNLQRLTSEVRSLFCLSPEEFSDEDIHEALYVLRTNGLVSVRQAVPDAMIL